VHQGKVELDPLVQIRRWPIALLQGRNRFTIHVVGFDDWKDDESDAFFVRMALEQMDGSLQSSLERRNKNGLEVNLVRDHLLAFCLLDSLFMETDIFDLWLTIEPLDLVRVIAKL